MRRQLRIAVLVEVTSKILRMFAGTCASRNFMPHSWTRCSYAMIASHAALS
jgi:hypothetical protein